MALKEYAVRDVMRLLKEAAAARSVVTYGELWRLFDRVDTEGDQWDTLEQAVKLVCDPREAILWRLDVIEEDGPAGPRFLQALLRRAIC